MKTKEQWIDETMESIEGISSAKANPSLSDKLMQQISADNSVSPFGVSRLFWQIAAGLAILITINVVATTQYGRKTESSSSSGNPMASEYFSYIQTINL